MTFLTVTLIAAIVIIVQTIRASYWHSIAQERLVLAEKAESLLSRVNAESSFVKETVTRLASRTVLATLSDEQVEVLINAIGQLVTHNLQSPDRLNGYN